MQAFNLARLSSLIIELVGHALDRRLKTYGTGLETQYIATLFRVNMTSITTFGVVRMDAVGWAL